MFASGVNLANKACLKPLGEMSALQGYIPYFYIRHLQQADFLSGGAVRVLTFCTQMKEAGNLSVKLHEGLRIQERTCQRMMPAS